MDKSNDYTTERLTFERLADVTVLYKAVYGRTLPKLFFERKYDTSYTNCMYLGFIAYHKKQAVAFYGALPCFFKYENNIILVAQAGDAMTHPAHRKKELFVTLGNLTINLCKQEGIKFLFGFPNQHSFHGHVNKLNWQLVGEMEGFTIPIKTLPLEKISTKFFLLKKIYSIYIKLILNKKLLPELGIENSVIKEGLNGVYRDASYFRYKTYNNTWAININDAVVWCKIKNGLFIGDILCDENNFDDIIYKIKQLAGKLGVQSIHFTISKNTKSYVNLKKYAVPSLSFPIIINNLETDINLNNLGFTFADIDIF